MSKHLKQVRNRLTLGLSDPLMEMVVSSVRQKIFLISGVLLFVSTLQSCAYLIPSKEIVPPPQAALEKFSPAGIWLYEDKLVTGEANLDENGNGEYPWKKGYFVTETWEDGVWKGTWHQPGNDREGGFELELSADLSFAQGRWWYTRIGDDTSPAKPGGKFSLTRISP